MATYPATIGAGKITDFPSANLACYMPEVWSKKVLDFIEKELVCWKCIDTSWSDEMGAGKGDTLHINPLLEISATEVNTAAAPTAYDTAQGSTTDLIINYWWEAVVGINDMQNFLGSPDYEAKIIPKLSYAIAKKIDSTVAALFDAFAQAVGVEGQKVTYETLLAAKAYLDGADAPESDRFLIIDPETLQDLMQDEVFISGLYNAGNAVAKGFIGQSRTLGCSVLMTTNLEAINTNYHGAAMLHREAIAGALVQDIETATWREESRHTTFHRASAAWGLVEVRDTFGVWIKTRS